MAVRTDDSEVVKGVVGPTAVDVVELERYRSAVPRLMKADLAAGFFDSLRDQPVLELIGLLQSTVNKQFVERARWDHWASDPLPPSLSLEMGRIESYLPDPLIQPILIPTRPKSQLTHYLSNRLGSLRCIDDFAIAASAEQTISARSVRCWRDQAQFRDSLSNDLVVTTIRSDTQLEKNSPDRCRGADCVGKLPIRVLASHRAHDARS
jgi:hypothetical protein